MPRNGPELRKKIAKEQKKKSRECQKKKMNSDCALCKDELCEPVKLICGHSFCFICVYKFWPNSDSTAEQCPTCSHKLDLERDVFRNDSFSYIAKPKPRKRRTKKDGPKYNGLPIIERYWPHSDDESSLPEISSADNTLDQFVHGTTQIGDFLPPVHSEEAFGYSPLVGHPWDDLVDSYNIDSDLDDDYGIDYGLDDDYDADAGEPSYEWASYESEVSQVNEFSPSAHSAGTFGNSPSSLSESDYDYGFDYEKQNDDWASYEPEVNPPHSDDDYYDAEPTESLYVDNDSDQLNDTTAQTGEFSPPVHGAETFGYSPVVHHGWDGLYKGYDIDSDLDDDYGIDYGLSDDADYEEPSYEWASYGSESG